MNQRIKQLISFFPEKKIDAFLVVKEANVTYLSCFPSRESWLLVAKEKARYITDFRYVLEAKKNLRGIPVRQYKGQISKCLFTLACEQKIRRIGIDTRHISHFFFKKLQRESPKSITFVPANNYVESLRESKAPSELSLIKKAISINLKAFHSLKHFIKPGVSERDILGYLESFVKRHNVSFSFPPIVASGVNSCLPHASLTSRKLKKRDLVLVDVGIDVKGYKSDLTRMFFLGKIPIHIKEMYHDVCSAQHEAIKAIKPGVEAKKIDLQARNYLKKKRLDKYFGHSLGHGVGLEIHEGPTLSTTSSSILREGMVVTVEPAVYIPHQFGVRIEDMVLVTKLGYKILSSI